MRQKPPEGMYGRFEGLAWLRERQPGFWTDPMTKDQMTRVANAVLDLTGRPPRWGKARFFTQHDLELILIAHTTKVLTSIQYEPLGYLARLARRKGIDEIELFEDLVDQAVLDLPADRLPAGVSPLTPIAPLNPHSPTAPPGDDALTAQTG